MTKLPKVITDQRMAVLRLLEKEKTRLIPRQMRDKLEVKYHHGLTPLLGNMLQTGLVDRNGSGYKLAPKGRAVLDNIADIEIIPFQKLLKTNRKRTQHPPPAAEPVQLNMSPAAENVADHITMLIDENVSYRKLMLQVYTLIGAALGLETEEKGNGNSSTD